MRRKLVATCVYAASIALAVGCGLDVTGTDFGDFVGDDDASSDVTQHDAASDVAGDGTVDATVDGAGDGASDAGSDVTADAQVDTGPPDAGPCPLAPLPLCDDDAAACGTGTACAPAVPTGWQLVSFGATPQASCPAGFGAANADAGMILYDASTPSSCSCGCTTTPGSCAAAGALHTGAVGSCASDAGDVPTSPSCDTVSLASLPAQFSAQVVQPTQGTTCQPDVTADLPAVDGGAAHVCELVDASAVCADHRFCVPLATGGDRACISHDGSLACPSGFPFQVARDVSDTRGCTCECAANEGTCSGSVHLYPSVGCVGGGDVVIPYDGGCLDIDAGSAGLYGSADLEAPVAGGTSCTPSGGLDGGVDASVTTVCCATP